jgi:serine/threonine protein phosphatase PrpC
VKFCDLCNLWNFGKICGILVKLIFILLKQTQTQTQTKTMTSFSNPQPRFQFTWATDIGGGRENQDNAFIYQNQKENILVVGILDGHGQEFGKIAATAAREKLIQYFQQNYAKLREDPRETLIHAFVLAHEYVKESLREEITKKGFKVTENIEGDQTYWTYRRNNLNDQWICIHGGTTCTIVAIVDYMKYTVNVGDSDAVLFDRVPIFNQAKDLQYLGDSAEFTDGHVSETMEGVATNYMVLNASHSPENLSEFNRMRAFCEARHMPNMRFIYDDPKKYKSQCPPIFSVDASGVASINTTGGVYCKNVRGELASLVNVHASARFPDALAFTRSIGDLHLHVYGVTHMPEIHCVDLREIFSRKMDSTPLCLVVASDGVWDNWTYEDMSKFMMMDLHTRIDAKKLIQQNDIYAKQNFGLHSDNATAIVVYITAGSMDLDPLDPLDYDVTQCLVWI